MFDYTDHKLLLHSVKLCLDKNIFFNSIIGPI